MINRTAAARGAADGGVPSTPSGDRPACAPLRHQAVAPEPSEDFFHPRNVLAEADGEDGTSWIGIAALVIIIVLAVGAVMFLRARVRK